MKETMCENVELKAYYPDRQKACDIAKSMRGKLLRSGVETDTYFRAPRGRLKVRTSDPGGDCLIYYERPNMPQFRTSSFSVVPIESGRPVIESLSCALGVLAVVKKNRDAFEVGPALVNVDEVEGLGGFVEFEVEVAKAGGEQAAAEFGDRLKEAFGISIAETVPWSYVNLWIMHREAQGNRRKLQQAEKAGTLFLFDGASCSGKTTLVSRLAGDEELGVAYIPRYCTRSKRSKEERSKEYRFVSRRKFEDLAAAGAFIEYRDFEFGMSYGLPWKEALKALLAGRNAAGIINLGDIAHVKRVLPEAVTILIDAPLKDIEGRLTARGVHTPSQVEERLTNARNAQLYRAYYDHIVLNPDGGMEQAYTEICTILRSTAGG